MQHSIVLFTYKPERMATNIFYGKCLLEHAVSVMLYSRKQLRSKNSGVVHFAG
jgi:hypothetical protein